VHALLNVVAEARDTTVDSERLSIQTVRAGDQ
jgi:hypothetical protein